MASVSSFDANGFHSEYFKIDHNISSSDNFLNISALTLLNYLAVADVFNSVDSKETCNHTLEQLLAQCKTLEEKAKLKSMLYKAAEFGGYATEFLKEVQPKFANILEEQVVEKVEEKKTKFYNNGAVSKIYSRGIQSDYFDVEKRPTENRSNFKLNLAADEILFYLAMVDIEPTLSAKEKLNREFYTALSCCNDQAEFEGLKEFLESAAAVGGYAADYYYEVEGLINEEGKEKAINYLSEGNKDKKLEETEDDLKKIEEQKEENIQALQTIIITNYNALHNRLVEIYNSPTKDSDEVEELLARYKKDKETLYSYNQQLEKGFFEDMAEKLDGDIRYLNKLVELFDQTQAVLR